MVPLDTQADFCPLINHASPSCFANRSNAVSGFQNCSCEIRSESDPWAGSVIAQQPMNLAS